MVTKKKSEETETSTKAVTKKKAPVKAPKDSKPGGFEARAPVQRSTRRLRPRAPLRPKPRRPRKLRAAPDAPKAVSTKSLVFHAPDPALFPAWKPGNESEPGEKTVRRRTRADRAAKVEEAKASSKSSDSTVQKVRGSTRLEAKRQRRRDGREGTRRRQSVTESEFLARRESVDRVMAVRETPERTQIAVIEDSVVVEHYVARSEESSLIGNVYLGRVQNVLPSMEAAFVDIGRGRNAVLYSGEVDWEAASEAGVTGPRRIEAALKTGDSVLVQVTKDPYRAQGCASDKPN